jgi:hypothetical protein
MYYLRIGTYPCVLVYIINNYRSARHSRREFKGLQVGDVGHIYVNISLSYAVACHSL